MNWTEIKRCIYYEDGSLRDIYIRNITLHDWKRWIDFVHTNYKIEFEVGNSSLASRIDFNAIIYYWSTRVSECPAAAIHIGDVIVKTYFLQETEIENDIHPAEVRSLDQHKNLVNYLQSISKLLGKPVELTGLNPGGPDEILMLVQEDHVSLLGGCKS